MSKSIRLCTGGCAALVLVVTSGCGGEAIDPDAGCTMSTISPNSPQQSLNDLAAALGAGGTGTFQIPFLYPIDRSNVNIAYTTLSPINCDGSEVHVSATFTWNVPPMYIGIDDTEGGAVPPPGPDPAGSPMTVAQFDIRLVVDPYGDTQVIVNGPALGSTAASFFSFAASGLMEYSPPTQNGRLSSLQFPQFAGDTTSVYRAEYTVVPGGVNIQWITGCSNTQTTISLTSSGGIAPAQCTPDAGPPTFDGGSSGGSYDGGTGDDGGTSSGGGTGGDDGGGGADATTGDDGGTPGDDGGMSDDATTGDDGGGGGSALDATASIGLASTPVGRRLRPSAQDDAGGGCAVGSRAGSSMLGGAAGLLGLALGLRRRRRGSPAGSGGGTGGAS
jgi:hypothetical protein